MNGTFRVYAPARIASGFFDFDITIKAADKDLVFGDTKEGSMAIRVPSRCASFMAKTNRGKDISCRAPA